MNLHIEGRKFLYNAEGRYCSRFTAVFRAFLRKILFIMNWRSIITETQIKKSHRVRNIVIIVLAALIVLALAGLAFIGNYFYGFALDPNNPDGYGTPAEIEDNEYTRWLFDNSADIFITSEDGLQLHAYRVEGTEPHKYAVICHGYQSNAAGMALSAMRIWEDLEYTLILPDARGHGDSEGEYIGMGWHERRDVIGWINNVIDSDPDAEIMLYGVSMGAATVMNVSGETDLPANVFCVVEDCGYTSVWDEFASVLYDLYSLPPVPILNATSIVCDIKAGYTFKEASPIKQVAKSSTPTLFIHGDADTFVPYSMLDELYNAASCEKEKMVIHGAAHAMSSRTDPDTYWQTVEDFIYKYTN